MVQTIHTCVYTISDIGNILVPSSNKLTPRFYPFFNFLFNSFTFKISSNPVNFWVWYNFWISITFHI